MSDKKVLLIIGGGVETVLGVERAQAMNLRVLVSDVRVDAPCMALVKPSDRLVVSTGDITATSKAAEKWQRDTSEHIDGVISIGTDVPRTVATVARDLGLFSIPFWIADWCSDKAMMKDVFRRRDIPTAPYKSVYSVDQLRECVRTANGLLVLKPVDSRGARGVIRLLQDVDLDWAFKYAMGQSSAGRVMVEKWLDGPQVSTEGVVLDGVYHPVAMIDRNYGRLNQVAPFVVEDGGQQPTQFASTMQNEINDLLQKVVDAFNYDYGTLKGDIVVHDGRPHVIEVAPRLSGGYMSTVQVPLATGVDLVGIAIRIALGEYVDPCECDPKCDSRQQIGVAIRYFWPAPGKVLALGKVDDVPNVARSEWFVKQGGIVCKPSYHAQRAGYVITTGYSRESAMGLADRIVSDNPIVTDNENYESKEVWL